MAMLFLSPRTSAIGMREAIEQLKLRLNTHSVPRPLQTPTASFKRLYPNQSGCHTSALPSNT